MAEATAVADVYCVERRATLLTRTHGRRHSMSSEDIPRARFQNDPVFVLCWRRRLSY